MEGKRDEECRPGTAQGLRPQNGRWEEVGRGQGEIERQEAQNRGKGLALSRAPGEFSFIARYPP